MDNRKNLFDLVQEKRELDIFLTTIAGNRPLTAPDQELLPMVTEEATLPPLGPSAGSNQIFLKSPLMPLEEIAPLPIIIEHREVKRLDSPPITGPVFIPERRNSVRDLPARLGPVQDESMIYATGRENIENRDNPAALDRPSGADRELNEGDAPPTSEPADGGEEISKIEVHADNSPVREKRSRRKLILIGTGIMIVVIALAAQGYLWLYPDNGQQALRWLSANVPYMDQYLGNNTSEKNALARQVRFINVKQRLVKNTVLERDIRIIEGMVENQAAFSMHRIKILGELYDPNATMLAAKMALCGNIISDDNLANLSEEDLMSPLAMSLGGDLSNSKIPPKGQMPFMIIFTREPAGVAKATVMAAGFEKSE